MFGIVAALVLTGLPGGVAMTTSAAATTVPASKAVATAPTGASGPLLFRRGKLTTRPASLPSTSVPARRLASAKVEQDIEDEYLNGTFVLRAAATSSTSSYLFVGFGRWSGGSCGVSAYNLTPTLDGSETAGFTISGKTITLHDSTDGLENTSFDCAVARLMPSPDAAPFDQLGGRLVDVRARPRLTMSKVRFLSRNVKTLKLVPGVWTKVELEVTNSGNWPASKVRVRGTGKAMKVRTANFGRINDPGSWRDKVEVRLGSHRRTKLKLVARSADGTAVSRVVKVRAVKAPAAPKPGSYRGKGGQVKFRVKGRKITNFGIRANVTCGSYPDLPTTRVQGFPMPNHAIPRNGIVDFRVRRDGMERSLQLKIVGGRVSAGDFRFNSGVCRAHTTFAARRAG
ncbi:hypothetical protein ASG90_09380 [Nocardioides sp. Soil797]|nr:hypothetical protein ASG90_09380 [Nocardioides sp. Soil797]